MATSATTIAAAMAAKARPEVREHFDQSDAFSPTDAVTYDPPGTVHRSQFDALVGCGIVKITGDDRYWLDREAERADEDRRRAAAMLVLKIVVAGFAVAVAAFVIASAMR